MNGPIYRTNNSSQPVWINGLPVINNLSDAQEYAVTIDRWECVTWSLFDSTSYPAAGATTLTFFSQPVGQGVGFSGGVKTMSDTNMQQAAQLSTGQAFIVTAVNVEFNPATPTVTAGMPAVFGAQLAATSVNDAYIFRRSGNLNFQILAKSYLNEGPMMRFPAPNDFIVYGALADTTTAAASSQSRVTYARADGPSQILSPNNILIIPTQTFGVTLNWPEGVQAITNPARVFVRLEGMLLRQAQ